MGITGDEGTVSKLYTVLRRYHVYGNVSQLFILLYDGL